MSVNSSSNSNYLSHYLCDGNEVYLSMAMSLVALRILLLLPLSTFILYLGRQRWRQHRSSKTATHSDIFTYHVAAIELMWIFGGFCFIGGTYTHNDLGILHIGVYTSSSTLSGEILFHVLTCVERYLAVVHPITYMTLRNARGVRIRNICIGCVWLLCFGLFGVMYLSLPNYTEIPTLCFLVFSIITITFSSLSVLCVLNGPGPGEGGGEKQKADQSKQRAFYTITTISAAVWLWFVGHLVYIAVDMLPQLNAPVRCLVMMSVSWLNLPSSLVSPLLYVLKAGKLSWCC